MGGTVGKAGRRLLTARRPWPKPSHFPSCAPTAACFPTSTNFPQVNATHAGVIFEAGVTEFAGEILFGLIALADLPAS